jgi:co-chaperonin GroES (HSP10)
MNVIHENVLVEIPEVVKEVRGVLLPESDIVVEREGIVIRFGEAVPLDVKNRLSSKPTVKYKEYFDGAEITIDKKSYIVMNYKDILIIL